MHAAGNSNDVSNSTIVPTTPGASEMVEQSAAIIGLGPHTLGSSKRPKEKTNSVGKSNESKNIDNSSPRVLRRSSRNSKQETQNEEIDKDESLAGNKGLVSDGPSVRQENVVVVEDSVPVSGVDEESQESNRSVLSVRDIFFMHEDSRDMFEDDAVIAEDSDEEVLLVEEQSQEPKVHEKDTKSQNNVPRDPSSPGPVMDDQSGTVPKEKGANQQSQSSILSAPGSVSDNIEMSQKSCKDDYTEALIPPTPPCENMSKSYMTMAAPRVDAVGGTKGQRKSGTQNKHNESAPASLFSNRRTSSVGDHNSTVDGKSLVLETPAVTSKKRARRSVDAEDTVVADTPTCQRQAHVILYQDEHQQSAIEAEEQNITGLCLDDDDDGTSAIEESRGELTSVVARSNSSTKAKSDLVDTDAGNDAGDIGDLPISRKMTSQVIGDTPGEVTVLKSSNESDEIIRKGRKRRKPAIEEDISDQESEDDDGDVIGRQKRRKSQRMVAVGEDEENESDDELIPCSFLQQSVKEQEEAVEDAATGHIEEDGKH